MRSAPHTAIQSPPCTTHRCITQLQVQLNAQETVPTLYSECSCQLQSLVEIWKLGPCGGRISTRKSPINAYDENIFDVLFFINTFCSHSLLRCNIYKACYEYKIAFLPQFPHEIRCLPGPLRTLFTVGRKQSVCTSVHNSLNARLIKLITHGPISVLGHCSLQVYNSLLIYTRSAIYLSTVYKVRY